MGSSAPVVANGQNPWLCAIAAFAANNQEFFSTRTNLTYSILR